VAAAYLDLEELGDELLPSLRIVDERGRSVPYVVETRQRSRSLSLAPRVERVLAHSELSLGGVPPKTPLSALELSCDGPEYFTRAVDVYRLQRDARGVVGRVALASASWERLPGQPLRPLLISLGGVVTDELRVDIDNGDNAPLTVTSASVLLESRRIDFLFSAGDSLTLLADNPQLSPPRYDLVLIAEQLLSSPAAAARLGPAPVAPSKADAHDRPAPAWFWLAVAGVGALLVLMLLRSLLGAKPPAEKS
jgi:hypothetical protein